MNNSLSIADQNSTLLGIMSTVLVAALGIPMNDEMQQLIVTAVMCKLALWYEEHGKEFNPKTILLDEDAVSEVFAEIHADLYADLVIANICQQTGIGLE